MIYLLLMIWYPLKTLLDNNIISITIVKELDPLSLGFEGAFSGQISIGISDPTIDYSDHITPKEQTNPLWELRIH